MVIALLAACNGGAVGPKSSSTYRFPPEAVLADEVVFVDVPAPFTASESTGDTFDWEFGDGERARGRSVRHAYAAPGRYTVLLTARSDGQTDTANASRVAVWPPVDPAPTASGRLALSDGVLYAVLPDSDEVVVVEGGVATRFGVCGHPEAVSAAAGRFAVACRDDAVELWDAASRTRLVAVTTRWGARPVGIAADPEGGAWVALAGTGEVVHVALDGAITTLAAVPDARGIAAQGGVVFAARFRSPDDAGVAFRIDEAAVTEFALPLDPGPDSDTDARGLPTLLGAVAVRPDGRAVAIAGSKANIERGLQRDGLAYTHETASRSALRLVDPVTGVQLGRAMFDNRDRVGAVAFTPVGDQLLVAHYGAGIVDFLDPVTLERIGGLQNVGVGLDGLATDGATAWVLASLDRELVSYDLTAGNAQVEIARISLADASAGLGATVFAFAGDPRMTTDAYLSCASCHPDGAGDGRTWDFTDRGEGLRDTAALFAMPSAGPFHWTANFDELQDFENAIRAHQAGLGFLDDLDFVATEDPLGAPKAGLSVELDAMAAYIRTFAADVPRSPWRAADGSPTAAGLRGGAVFTAAGCAVCHAGPELTDALVHDIGTILPSSGSRLGEPLTGIRTPSLRGLFATAPYLHDGRAATVEEAVTAHPVPLDPADLADLAAYLRELEGSP